MTGNDGSRRLPSTYTLPLRILFLLGIMLGMLAPATHAQTTGKVEIIKIDDTITPVMARYVERGINRAENRGMSAVILEIDTPGGLSSAMDDIVRSVLESDIPVIAYVSPRGARAASAGVYITYAAHVAAMAPGTNIGSASPVAIGGAELDDTMEAKVVNDAVAQIRNLAEFRGRNADWAEDAVRDAVNITADEALQLGVIDFIAPDVETLLATIDGFQVEMADGTMHRIHTAGAETDVFDRNFLESILQLISDPTIAYMLLSAGALGLFLELSNPGALIPGIFGAISLILGLFALGTLPVNWTGVLLIGVGFALFFIDIFVSSFGLLFVGGITCFIVGSYLLIDTTVPGYDGVSRPVIWSAAACVTASAMFIGWSILRIRRKKPTTGMQSMIGLVGEAREPLTPSGLVFVDGELWSATLADGGSVPVGSRVEVVRLEGLELTVKPAAQLVRPMDTESGNISIGESRA